jgi:hypothetical protein
LKCTIIKDLIIEPTLRVKVVKFYKQRIYLLIWTYILRKLTRRSITTPGVLCYFTKLCSNCWILQTQCKSSSFELRFLKVKKTSVITVNKPLRNECSSSLFYVLSGLFPRIVISCVGDAVKYL